MPCSDRLSTLILAAGFLHVAEEAACGWVAWTRAFIPGVTWAHFVIGNALFLAFLAFAPRLAPRWPAWGLAAPLLLLLNIPVHLVPTLRSGIWSPGLLSALLLYAPIALVALRQARRRGLSWFVFLRGTVLATGAMLLPFLFQALRLHLSA